MPRSAGNDLSNRSLRHAVGGCELRIRGSAGRMVRPNVPNRCPSEFGLAVPFALANLRVTAGNVPISARQQLRARAGAIPVTGRRASLRLPVRHVVSMRAEPKMRRIDAGAVVSTGAVVQDLNAIRNRAVCQNPRNAVGSVAPAVETKLTVSVRESARGPQPTGGRPIRAVNLRPEPFCDRISGHDLNLQLGSGSVAPGVDASHRPAFVCSELYRIPGRFGAH